MSICYISLPAECSGCSDAPRIGENGNWFINDADTGIKAAGQNGITPHIGENGNWYVGDADTGILAGSSTNVEQKLADLEMKCESLNILTAVTHEMYPNEANGGTIDVFRMGKLICVKAYVGGALSADTGIILGRLPYRPCVGTNFIVPESMVRIFDGNSGVYRGIGSVSLDGEGVLRFLPFSTLSPVNVMCNLWTFIE